MAILTKSGRAAIAASIKQQPIHLAWGTGEPTWESTHTVTKTFADDQITLDHHPIKNVTLKQGETIFISGTDYNVDSVMGIISRLPNGNIPADSTLTIDYTYATPPEPITASTLLHEVGRRIADEVIFCTGDENDDLITPTGRFKASSTPTNNLFLRFTFDFDNASNQISRELGVMVGTLTKPNLPPGQRYFAPTDIDESGILLVLERTVPLIRTAATRETFSFVVTF
jgi:hypothetical protein